MKVTLSGLFLSFLLVSCTPATQEQDEETVQQGVRSPMKPNPKNRPPVVSAGPDLSVNLPDSLDLRGTASDDGLPAGSTLSRQWTKVSGPGAISFATPALASTTAAFSAAGTYHIRFTASDGILSSSDDLIVIVSPGSTTQPPSTTAGCDFYVAPSSRDISLGQTATVAGTPQGTGSLTQPWDLQTALDKPSSLVTGKSICLRGGTYRGGYLSNISGAAAAPVKLRSAPGEWAKFDGFLKTTLAKPFLASDTSITLSADVFPHRLPEHAVDVLVSWQPGATATAPGDVSLYEEMQLRNPVSNGDGTITYTQILFRYNPKDHPAGHSVVLGESSLSVRGAHTWVMDLEFMSSDPTRLLDVGGVYQGKSRGGIELHGAYAKLINSVFHDSSQIGFWAGSVGGEIHGVLSYNNGWLDPVRGHGHGMYMQNPSTAVDKHVRNSMVFWNSATGMKAFGERGFSNRFIVDQMTAFDNSMWNVEFGSGDDPTHQATIKNSVLYRTGLAGAENLRMGYRVPGSTGANVLDNLLLGGTPAFSINDFTSGEVTGNTVVSSYLAQAQLGAVPFSAFTWNNNRYHDLSAATSCNDPGNGVPQRLTFSAKNPTPHLFTCGGGGQAGNLPFHGVSEGWRQFTGYDANSSYATGLPTGAEALKIKYFRNDYQAGRAHIIIVNWANLDSVTVDLSQTGLVANQRYEIRDAQNYFGPAVRSGTYADGQTVALPMNLTSVAAPVGNYWLKPTHTSKQFGTFVVVPLR